MKVPFPEKTTYWLLYFNAGLFPFGEFVDEVVNSHANYQGYRYDVHFLWCHTFAVIQSVDGEGVC